MTAVGLLGILVGLGLLIWLAFRGWSVLLLAPIAALIAALFSREPLLAHWTQTFMASAAGFLAQFFPLFLLGALFGKLMEDSGSVAATARFMTQRLGPQRAVLAVSYRRLASLRTTMDAGANASVLPAMSVASLVGFGLWWLNREETIARKNGEGFGDGAPMLPDRVATDEKLRERATTAREFDPAEIMHGGPTGEPPPIMLAVLPLIVVIIVNLAMSLFILPALDTDFLSEVRWGETSLAAVGGVWAVITALACAIAAVLAVSYRRLASLRTTMDAGANASVLPAMSVASLVGFGAVVAAMPAFGVVRDAVLGIGGGPLVSLAVATNLLAALTGSASGGLTIALDALAPTYLARAAEIGLDPALLHRVAVIGSGTLDTLPHNGAVVTLLAICGSTHRDSYRDIVMVGIVGALVALAAVIALGSVAGSF